MPPVDYEAPTHPYRDASQASQNRLPFMTPIVEKTESSLAPSTIYQEKDYFNTKTPSRRHGDGTPVIPELDDEIFSPFKEIVNEAETGRRKGAYSVLTDEEAKGSVRDTRHGATVYTDTQPQGPIITDAQCNPVDENIRKTILDHIQLPLSSYNQFFDRRTEISGRSAEIRRFAKAVTKMTKNSSDKTTTNVSMPPILRLAGATGDYTIKRELGKGAFAPVYLVENVSACTSDNDDDEDNNNNNNNNNQISTCRSRLEALKMEHPPTAWEFYIMRAAATRLSGTRALTSITPAHELHLFADECFLIEQYRDQGTLLSLVNAAKTDPSTSTATGGVMDEVLAMFFTVELLRTVEAMHAVGLMHGDLKADNCLLRLDPVPVGDVPSCPAGQGLEGDHWSARYHADGSHGWSAKGLALIDFGRGIDMRVFRDGVQFVADWKTGPADCVEMREMRPWTWQVDCFGLAGVVHSMLFGKYIDTVVVGNHGEGDDDGGGIGGTGNGHGVGVDAKKRYKLKEPFKRYWQTELWTAVFDLLLNPARYVEREESGRMPVVRGMRDVREGLESWLELYAEKRGLRALLRRVEVGCRERRR